MAHGRAAEGCSCGLQHAGDKGAHIVRGLLGLDHAVHDDAAADTVTITLCRNTSYGRRPGDGELQRPRQVYSVNMLRVTIVAEKADVGHGPRWSKDLVSQVLGVGRLGVVDSGVGIRD